MKKIRNVLMILLVIILCVGCGQEEEKGKVFNRNIAKEKISALKFTNTDFTFSDSSNLNNNDGFKVYGVDTTLFVDSLSYLSNDITDPSMYLIVKTDQDNKSILKYQIKDMFEKYYNSYNNYYPKESKMIQDRLEKEYEGYLIYIVSYDNNSVYQAIQDSFA